MYLVVIGINFIVDFFCLNAMGFSKEYSISSGWEIRLTMDGAYGASKISVSNPESTSHFGSSWEFVHFRFVTGPDLLRSFMILCLSKSQDRYFQSTHSVVGLSSCGAFCGCTCTNLLRILSVFIICFCSVSLISA